MQVFQIRVKMYLLQTLSLEKMQESVTEFMDIGFLKDEGLSKLHEANQYKYYCYDLPYQTNREGEYGEEGVYTLTVRTLDPTLARYFAEVCVNNATQYFKGLTSEIKIIPEKFIGELFSLTTVIIKTEQGYWRNVMGVDEFEERIKVNLIKKWNHFTGEKMDEDFQLYTSLEFLNEHPLGQQYKGRLLLGDKVRLMIADNENAQRLAYMALATGIGENNARGAGFVNYRWI